MQLACSPATQRGAGLLALLLRAEGLRNSAPKHVLPGFLLPYGVMRPRSKVALPMS